MLTQPLCLRCNQPVDPAAPGAVRDLFAFNGHASGLWHGACEQLAWEESGLGARPMKHGISEPEKALC